MIRNGITNKLKIPNGIIERRVKKFSFSYTRIYEETKKIWIVRHATYTDIYDLTYTEYTDGGLFFQPMKVLCKEGDD